MSADGKPRPTAVPRGPALVRRPVVAAMALGMSLSLPACGGDATPPQPPGCPPDCPPHPNVDAATPQPLMDASFMDASGPPPHPNPDAGPPLPPPVPVMDAQPPVPPPVAPP